MLSVLPSVAYPVSTNSTHKPVMLCFSYLQVARAGGFVLWASSLSPQFMHWVRPLTTQGFLTSFIIPGCVCQPPKFLLWGLCPLTAPDFVFVLWGLSLLTTPLSLQGVFANHPITCPGCVATTHSHCYPREHPESIVPFTATFFLFVIQYAIREQIVVKHKTTEIFISSLV